MSLWTLRKQAARVLDLLAYSIPPHVTLSIALPVVQANFGHDDVWVYETGGNCNLSSSIICLL